MVNISIRNKSLIGLAAFLPHMLLIANVFVARKEPASLATKLYLTFDSTITTFNSLTDTANVYGHGTN